MDSLDFSKVKDISNWERQPDTSIVGTRDKIVLRSPINQKLCFIKFPKQNATVEIQRQEIITEHIATEIAKLIGLETHDCHPALYQGRFGINNLMLVQDKTDFQLVYPKQLIQEDLRQFEQNLPEDKDYNTYRKLHTLDNVLDVFYHYCSGYEGFFEEKFLPGLLRMIIFDALVGMMDRHWENYAVLKQIYLSINQTYSEAMQSLQKNPSLLESVYKAIPRFGKDEMLKIEVADMNFAPVYDNSSCLFWNLVDDKLPENEEQFRRFATNKKAWSQITIPTIDKANLFEVLEYIKNMTFSLESDRIHIPLAPILKAEFVKICKNYSSKALHETVQKSHFGLFSQKRCDLLKTYVDFRMRMIENVLNDKQI